MDEEKNILKIMPSKLPTEEDMGAALTAYFVECKNKELMPTKNGMMLALEIYSRETYNIWKKKSNTLKRFERKVEEAWVQTLRANNVAGSIFYLKNAFGYRDKKEFDHTSGGKPIPLFDFVKGKKP